MLMQADQTTSTQWDLMTMEHHPSAGEKFLTFFLLVAFIAVAVKLARTWWGAPPFVYLKRTLRPTYVAELGATKVSLGQWIGATLLIFGIASASEVGRFCFYLMESHAKGASVIAGEIWELMGLLEGTLVVVLTAYLVRWNVVNRMERLGNLHREGGGE